MPSCRALRSKIHLPTTNIMTLGAEALPSAFFSFSLAKLQKQYCVFTQSFQVPNDYTRGGGAQKRKVPV